MALFGKKKSTEEVPSGITDGGWRPQPDKAAKFFEHARTVAQTGNYSYAIDMYARGLRFEPDNMESHIALYETAVRYFNLERQAGIGQGDPGDRRPESRRQDGRRRNSRGPRTSTTSGSGDEAPRPRSARPTQKSSSASGSAPPGSSR